MTGTLATHERDRRRLRSGRTTCLGDIEIFAEVASAGSMTAAARRLGLAVTAVSKRIQRLEANLGARLLERSTRRIILTEAGRGFHQRIGGILEAFEEAVDFTAEVSTSLSGTLRVTAPVCFGRMHLAPHLPRFLDAHPSLELDLDLSDETLDLAANGFHVALRVGELPDSSLIAKKLAPVHQVLCAAPAYLENYGDPHSVGNLADHKLLAPEPETSWRLSGPEGCVTVPVRGRLRTPSWEVIREAVIGGAGIGLLPTWNIGRELADRRLQVVLPDHRADGRAGLFAVYPSRELMPCKARSFMDFLTSLYGPRPYWERGTGIEDRHARYPAAVSPILTRSTM